MGQKINARGLRLGITADWHANWVQPKGKAFADTLAVDLKLRELLTRSFKNSGIDRIVIDRPSGDLDIKVFVAKPGAAIGRDGQRIEEVKKKVQLLLKTKDFKLAIKEVQNPAWSARVIAREIADSIEARRSEKMLINKAMEKLKKAGVQGARIEIHGRIRGSKYHNTIYEVFNRVPRQTLRAKIDYACEEALVFNVGILSVKVWIYTGDKLD